jgi:hypothetical protein
MRKGNLTEFANFIKQEYLISASVDEMIQAFQNKPVKKKNCSSYIIFCQHKRQEIKKENPALSATEVARELGKRWNALGESEKSFFQQLSKGEVELKEEKEEKEDEKKKKTPSGYIIFCNENRGKVKDKHPSFSPKEITIELGKRWKQLDEKGKDNYNSKSKNFSENKDKEHQATKQVTKNTQPKRGKNKIVVEEEELSE